MRLSASAFRSTGDPRYLGTSGRAVRGDKDAASRISDMYAHGSNGVPAKPQRAEQWLRYSALLGNAIACYTFTAAWPTRATGRRVLRPRRPSLATPPKGPCGSRKWENC